MIRIAGKNLFILIPDFLLVKTKGHKLSQIFFHKSSQIFPDLSVLICDDRSASLVFDSEDQTRGADGSVGVFTSI